MEKNGGFYSPLKQKKGNFPFLEKFTGLEAA